jgi:hypothetical protein
MKLFLIIFYLVNSISYRSVYNPIKKISFQLFNKKEMKNYDFIENMNKTEAIKLILQKLPSKNSTKTSLEKVDWDDGEIPWDIEFYDF